MSKKRPLHISSDLFHGAEMSVRVVNGDEILYFQCDKEKKRQGMQWKSQNTPRHKKSTHILLVVQDHACGFPRSQ
jgi:hypothetical protein